MYQFEIRLHETMSHLEWRLPVDSVSGEPLHVDLSLDHTEPVILHEVYSGAPGSLDVLERLQFTPRTRRVIRRRLRRLPEGDYVGVHIRHSDLQTDYVPFLAQCADALAGRNVLVCSDDGDVLQQAPLLLPRLRVATVSSVPPSRGVPYQADFHPRRRARRKLAIDTLVDLIALASASEVIFPEIANCATQFSGFSRLARDLAGRPDIIDGLLGTPSRPQGS